jgi:hypothetical protein
MTCKLRQAYEDWAADKQWPDGSFDSYLLRVPNVAEYYVFKLISTTPLSHADDAEPLSKSCSLGDAMEDASEHFYETCEEVAVYEPRTQSYRAVYTHKTCHVKRNANGKFTI